MLKEKNKQLNIMLWHCKLCISQILFLKIILCHPKVLCLLFFRKQFDTFFIFNICGLYLRQMHKRQELFFQIVLQCKAYTILSVFIHWQNIRTCILLLLTIIILLIQDCSFPFGLEHTRKKKRVSTLFIGKENSLQPYPGFWFFSCHCGITVISINPVRAPLRYILLLNIITAAKSSI